MPRANKTQRQERIDKQKFAALFTAEGTSTYGDIDAANKVLGTAFDLCDDDIRMAIEGYGIAVPPCGSKGKLALTRTSNHVEADSESLAKDVGDREEAWRNTEFTMPEPDAGKEEWCRKYRTLEPVINDIAIGKIKASAAQARILSNIEQRCYGPIVKEEAEQAKSGVLLLPMIGMGSEMMICPKCGYVHQGGEEEEFDAPIGE